MLMLFATDCGDRPAPNATAAGASRSPTASAASLLCAESEQTAVDLDVPGPGRPTPEEAVAPYADALTLVVHQGDDGTTVLGLHADKTVARVFDVTKRGDGWWADGYRECLG